MATSFKWFSHFIYLTRIVYAFLNFPKCPNHLIFEIIWNANLMQQGNFIDVFLARHVSGTYIHHQEH